MKTVLISSLLTAFLRTAAAVGVTGSAEGFAKGVTGGGSATPVYPSTTAELVSYLGDSSPRVIILQKTFDFSTSEGTTTATGCAPWGTGSTCQLAINQNSWCDNYQATAKKVTVKYNNAAKLGILVKSNKSIVGVGAKGIIKGKGLRIVSGASNVIIQNIHITDLNPSLVWGGDGITINNSDMVWIDHVTTSLMGRQHIVLGTSASNRVTISNCDIDGTTSWSPNCDTYHYWGVYFAGSSDLVTFKNNYIHHTSGRSPKLAGNTLLHAVNNYWSDNNGHAFEIDAGAMVLAEGNIFQNVKTIVEAGGAGKIFSSPNTSANTACKTHLGHNCEVNGFGSSGTLSGTDTSFISNFSGKKVAAATTYTVAKTVKDTAGFGNI